MIARCETASHIVANWLKADVNFASTGWKQEAGCRILPLVPIDALAYWRQLSSKHWRENGRETSPACPLRLMSVPRLALRILDGPEMQLRDALSYVNLWIFGSK
jgi:hypothetical protein